MVKWLIANYFKEIPDTLWGIFCMMTFQSSETAAECTN
jgi:hypothetical protein